MSTSRIVFVVPQLAPVYGLERATLALVRELSAHHEVVVLALSGPRPAVATGDTWEFRSLGLGSGVARLIQAVLPLRAALVDVGASKVVASGVWAALPTLVGIGRRAEVLVWEHSLMADRLQAEPRLRALALGARLLYRRAIGVVAVSAAVADTVRAICGPGTRIRTVTNLVEEPGDRRPPSPARGPELRLLSVGALSPGKNHQLAVEALALLPAGSSLTICGEGPERQNLLETARRLGLSDRVSLPGYCSDVAERARDHDVVVHPSSAETFGLAALEASWLGKPVAVLDRACLNTFVPRLCPGAVSHGDSPAGFAEAILRASRLAGDVDAFEQARAAYEDEMSPGAVVDEWKALLGLSEGAATC